MAKQFWHQAECEAFIHANILNQSPSDAESDGSQKGRKRKQVLTSESDDSGGEESPPESGSDWSQVGKQAAASPDADDDDDDDISMIDDSDQSPSNAGKGSASGKKRKKPTPAMVRSLAHLST